MTRRDELERELVENYSWRDAEREKAAWSEEVFPPRKQENWNTISHCDGCDGCPHHKVVEEKKESEWEIEYTLISSCGGQFESNSSTGRTWCKERQIIMPIPTLSH